MAKFNLDFNFDSRKLESRPVILSVLMLIGGLILFFRPGMALSVVVKVLAIGLLVGGLSNLLNWYRNRESVTPADGVTGGVMALAGLVLLIWPGLIVNIVPVVLGGIILLNGLVNLFKALDLKKTGYSGWTGSALMAAVTVIAGVIVLANPAWIARNLVRIVGGVLIYNAVTSLFIATRKA
ncbi:MAG: DUF308 domain-containing protein [Clostridia bacterium]|nr:DUF308 domain-containing protein [Clostridia bacterium]